MIKNSLFSGDMDISLLGFGAMRFPVNKEDQTINYDEAAKLIDLAYEKGINYYDTAYVYHQKQSEAFLGKALAKYPRDSYFLTSKLSIWEVKTPEELETMFNKQLENCCTEYFDVYLAHAMDGDKIKKFEELGGFEFMKKKKEEGKIRHLGFSFHGDIPSFKKLLSMEMFEVCQLQLNYADWYKFKAGELYDLATEAGLPIIVMEPVRGGALANPLPDIEKLQKDYAPDKSCASWAFKFVAEKENVKLILSGMSNLEQVEDNLNTFADETVFPNPEEKDILEQCIKIIDAIDNVPCTGCAYCMPCPLGVDIPEIFNAYNVAKVFEGRKMMYKNTIKPENRADKCVACGKCVRVCPQNIPIPQRMGEIEEYYKDIV